MALIIVRRIAGMLGFHVLPKRWIVERTFGWLGRCRRLSKDYEKLPEASAAFIRLASAASFHYVATFTFHRNHLR